MTGSSVRYLVKEGFRNSWTNRMMSVASICVLLCCLVLIGSASMIFVNINSFVDKIEDEVKTVRRQSTPKFVKVAVILIFAIRERRSYEENLLFIQSWATFT